MRQIAGLAASLVAVGTLTGASAVGTAAPETRRALLIGIDKYIPAPAAKAPPSTVLSDAARGDSGRGTFGDLEGTGNDVEAMKAVLIARYGFAPENVHVLRDTDATRDRILNETRSWLVASAAAGDVSVFYYAGHGSQVRNSKSTEADKMDESIVPADFNLGIRDIRDKELARLFDEALDKKVIVTAIFDSCHSGSVTRGLKPIKTRSVKPDMRDVADPVTPVPPDTRGALILSAAQERQSASEIQVQEEGDTHHGLFTWALVKTLRTMPVNQSMDRTFLSVRSLMQSDESVQEPVLAGNADRKSGPLLGVGVSATAGFVVAVQSVRPDGAVILQSGRAAGLRANAELKSVSGTSGPVTLKVVAEQGMTLSRAEVLSGSSAAIAPGALFSISKWVAAPGEALRVFIPPGPLAGRVTPPEVADAVRGTALLALQPSINTSDYVLSARTQNGTVQYAWSRPNASAPGATTTLPSITSWVAVEDVVSVEDRSRAVRAATELRDLAVRLSVVRNWLYLESPADAGSFPYHLALRHTTTRALKTDGTARQDDPYGLVLIRDRSLRPSSVEPRYVYAFSIDKEGESILLFPSDSAGNVGNYLPVLTAANNTLPAEIQLGPPERFTMNEGVDTFFLLTTATPLPNPGVLNGPAVRTPSRGPSDGALGALLLQGGAVRGPTMTTPTDWSIERFTIRTLPKAGKH